MSSECISRSLFIFHYIRFLGRHSWPLTLLDRDYYASHRFLFEIALRIVLPKVIPSRSSIRCTTFFFETKWISCCHLIDGFAIAFEPLNLLLVIVGCAMGLFIGAMPGLGSVNGVAILLPLAFLVPQREPLFSCRCLLRRDVQAVLSRPLCWEYPVPRRL